MSFEPYAIDRAEPMLTVVKDGGTTVLPCPSSYEYGLMDISASDSGRTLDGKMDKARVTQKRKLALEWVAKNPASTSALLSAVNDEYIQVIYPDFLDGQYQMRTFYVGDRSAVVGCWWDGNQLIETIKFDLIEQ